MLKRLLLLGVLALALAAPAQAHGWKELRVRGVIVSVSAEVVTVDNVVGDATLRCLVPIGSRTRSPRSSRATRCGCSATACAAGGRCSTS